MGSPPCQSSLCTYGGRATVGESRLFFLSPTTCCSPPPRFKRRVLTTATAFYHFSRKTISTPQGPRSDLTQPTRDKRTPAYRRLKTWDLNFYQPSLPHPL